MVAQSEQLLHINLLVESWKYMHSLQVEEELYESDRAGMGSNPAKYQRTYNGMRPLEKKCISLLKEVARV